MDFSQFWNDLQTNLQPQDVIKNWTAANEYLGDKFEVFSVSEKAVVVDSPNAKNLQYVSKANFEFMYSNWDAYCSGKLQRHELIDKTRFSKYTISIIKHLKA